MKKDFPKPDFICVGPHKTGTAWLYKTLGAHKEVKRSSVKELDYFLVQDVNAKGILSSLGFKKSYLNRIIKRRLISKNIKKSFSKSSKARKRISYHLRILFGLFSFDFYSSFFHKDKDEIVGDISPSYYALSPATIQNIKERYPKLKVIIFLREPVSRISSHLRMMHSYNNISADEKKIEKNVVFLKAHNEKGLYPFHGLKNWLSVFDDEQIFVGFYDAFKKDPVLYYKDICRFLGISDNLESALDYQPGRNPKPGNRSAKFNFDSPAALLKYRYNSSKIKMEIPPTIIRSLCKHYYEDVGLLASFVDSPYPKEWLKYYDSIIQN